MLYCVVLVFCNIKKYLYYYYFCLRVPYGQYGSVFDARAEQGPPIVATFHCKLEKSTQRVLSLHVLQLVLLPRAGRGVGSCPYIRKTMHDLHPLINGTTYWK